MLLRNLSERHTDQGQSIVRKRVSHKEVPSSASLPINTEEGRSARDFGHHGAQNWILSGLRYSSRRAGARPEHPRQELPNSVKPAREWCPTLS
jgi:hypothetical protein